MHGLTDYITDWPWEAVFTTWYVLVDTAYQSLVTQTGPLRQRGPRPTFSDSEVITVALIAETFFHGHEELCLAFVRQYHTVALIAETFFHGHEELCLAFVRQYHHDLFPRLRDDTRFNRRRRLIAGLIEAMRQFYTAELIQPDDPVRFVESAPIPVCTDMRSHHGQTVIGSD